MATSSIRRPWWLSLFALAILVLTSLIFPCSGYCQGGEFDGDQKVDYYQRVEDGSSIWLNPNETYVPGSLRQNSHQSSCYGPNCYAPAPTYQPSYPSYQPYYQPQYQPAPPRYVPQYQPSPIPYYQPPAYGIDYGRYRQDCDTCGVKMDGAMYGPSYRNWSERRGVMKSGGADPLSEKKQSLE